MVRGSWGAVLGRIEAFHPFDEFLAIASDANQQR